MLCADRHSLGCIPALAASRTPPSGCAGAVHTACTSPPSLKRTQPPVLCAIYETGWRCAAQPLLGSPQSCHPWRPALLHLLLHLAHQIPVLISRMTRQQQPQGCSVCVCVSTSSLICAWDTQLPVSPGIEAILKLLWCYGDMFRWVVGAVCVGCFLKGLANLCRTGKAGRMCCCCWWWGWCTEVKQYTTTLWLSHMGWEGALAHNCSQAINDPQLLVIQLCCALPCAGLQPQHMKIGAVSGNKAPTTCWCCQHASQTHPGAVFTASPTALSTASPTRLTTL